MSVHRLFAGFFLCLALYVVPAIAAEEPSPAEATPVELPETLTKEEARSLMARLSDDQVRALLLQQLDKVAQSEAQPAAQALDFRQRATLWLAKIKQSWDTMMRAGELELRHIPRKIWDQVTEQGSYGTLRTLLELALALFAGWLLEWGFRRLSSGVLVSDDSATQSLSSRALIFTTRLILGLIALAVFGVGASTSGVLLFGESRAPARELLSVLVWTVLVYRLWALGLRALLAPHIPAWRFINISDAVARGLYHRALIVVAVLTLDRGVDNLLRVFSFDWEVVLAVSTLIVPIPVAVVLGIIVEARKPVAAMIRGDHAQPQGFRAGFANAWHLLAIAYLFAIVVLAIERKLVLGNVVESAGIVSLCLPLLAWLADIGLQGLCARLFPPESAAAPASATSAQAPPPPPGHDGRSSVYQALVLRYLRILLTVLVAMVFVALWDLDPSKWFGVLGQRVTDALFDISVTVFLAYIAWGIAKAAIESQTGPASSDSEEGQAGGDAEAGGVGGTRVETLLPLIRKFLWITLLVVVVMVSLSSLGVNIGPLLAGAGMVGIAIGFGAQTLVRDIVSGFFFLLDDAFRIGEYVEIDANTRGTVEKISVRSFQLRHHNGPVHTVPFGEIRSLTNYSRDWAIMKFELRLPFETNIDKVRKIIKKVGQEMQDDPEIGPQLLQPLKSQGVNRMDDSALIIRCKFTAVPGEQFVIRREAFTRIQRAFEEQGIHFAPRRVLVEATTPAAVAGAAAAALDQEGKPQAAGDDRG